MRSKEDASALLLTFSEFAHTDEDSIRCGLDGSSIVIDGITAGRHFSLYAINPGLCKTPDAQRIADALSRLVTISKRAP